MGHQINNKKERGTMKNLLLILTDNPIDPSGGLGERFKYILPLISEHYNIQILCHGKSGIIGKAKILGIRQEKTNIIESFLYYFKKNKNKINKPDIVLGTDIWSIIPSIKISKYYNAKFILEFDLAYFSYSKIIDLDNLSDNFNVNGKIVNIKKQSEDMLKIENLGIQECDKLILCSDYYKKEIPELYKKKSVSIPNGINLNIWNRPFNEFNFPLNKKYNIVYIGRLNRQKGIQSLFNLKLPEEIGLHFVGGQKGSDLFYETIASVGLDPLNKSYLGFANTEEKINILNSCDAVIMPSLHEPFGIVGLEAFASKSILITTRVNGIADYTTENNSIYFNHNNPG